MIPVIRLSALLTPEGELGSRFVNYLQENIVCKAYFCFFLELQTFKTAAEKLSGQYTFAFAAGKIAKERYDFRYCFDNTSNITQQLFIS